MALVVRPERGAGSHLARYDEIGAPLFVANRSRARGCGVASQGRGCPRPLLLLLGVPVIPRAHGPGRPTRRAVARRMPFQFLWEWR
jgi:hypothetical protein